MRAQPRRLAGSAVARIVFALGASIVANTPRVKVRVVDKEWIPKQGRSGLAPPQPDEMRDTPVKDRKVRVTDIRTGESWEGTTDENGEVTIETRESTEPGGSVYRVEAIAGEDAARDRSPRYVRVAGGEEGEADILSKNPGHVNDDPDGLKSLKQAIDDYARATGRSGPPDWWMEELKKRSDGAAGAREVLEQYYFRLQQSASGEAPAEDAEPLSPHWKPPFAPVQVGADRTGGEPSPPAPQPHGPPPPPVCGPAPAPDSGSGRPGRTAEDDMRLQQEVERIENSDRTREQKDQAIQSLYDRYGRPGQAPPESPFPPTQYDRWGLPRPRDQWGRPVNPPDPIPGASAPAAPSDPFAMAPGAPGSNTWTPASAGSGAGTPTNLNASAPGGALPPPATTATPAPPPTPAAAPPQTPASAPNPAIPNTPQAPPQGAAPERPGILPAPLRPAAPRVRSRRRTPAVRPESRRTSSCSSERSRRRTARSTRRSNHNPGLSRSPSPPAPRRQRRRIRRRQTRPRVGADRVSRRRNREAEEADRAKDPRSTSWSRRTKSW